MATEKQYDFKYLPLEGKLPGKSFERQTEDAINDLGDLVIQIEAASSESSDLAQKAYDKAVAAETTADAAKAMADNAQQAAEAAQKTADNAQTTANAAQTAADAAQTAADKAQETADEAKTAAEVAQTDATEALQTANTAEKDAEAAQFTADTALSAANANSESIANINTEISEIKNYDVVGTVDLNDYYTEFARLYVDADSANAPVDTEKFFVDVDVNSEMTQVRQIATGETSGGVWIRYGVVTEDEEEEQPEGSLTPTSGTLVVNGDLSADIVVNGSVQVTGEISSNVTASGTVTYGTLTGEVTENAELDECDIQIDGANFWFSSDLTEQDGKLTSGQVSVASGATVDIYRDMAIEVEGDEDEAIYSAGTLHIAEGCDFTATIESDNDGYGIDNNRGTLIVSGTASFTGAGANNRDRGIAGGTVIVDDTGTLTATGGAYGITSSKLEVNGEAYFNSDGTPISGGTITGTGQVYVNGELYYDGGGSTGYSVEWGEWFELGTGAIDVATDDEVEAGMQDVFGITID